jgi:hypothetical protein
MHDLSDLFCGLLRLVGMTVDGESERNQALAVFAFCGVLSGVAGCFTSGLAATVWLVFTGVFVVLFVVAHCFAE